jgi:hypothetical protein
MTAEGAHTRHAIRLGVVGSRKFTHREALGWFLDRYALEYDLQLVVSGGAVGADKLAEAWAVEHGIPVRVFEPDYTQYGKAAPFVRNAEIVESSDRLLAFYASTEKTPGTSHTVQLARRRGLPVEEVFATEAMLDAFNAKHDLGAPNGGQNESKVVETPESPSGEGW